MTTNEDIGNLLNYADVNYHNPCGWYIFAWLMKRNNWVLYLSKSGTWQRRMVPSEDYFETREDALSFLDNYMARQKHLTEKGE